MEAGEGVGTPRLELGMAVNAQCGHREPSSGLVQEQQAPLTAEPPLQPRANLLIQLIDEMPS